MDTDPPEDAGQHESQRQRPGGWLAATAIVVVGALVLVTGAVLLWLVITTLGAFIKTVF